MKKMGLASTSQHGQGETYIKKEKMEETPPTSVFPGFRFSPTDVELISYYLQKKMDGCDKCLQVISEVDICKYEPWDLPAKSVIESDNNEWFFFSARGRKYPTGSQSKRATQHGYWKATGKQRNVKAGSAVIGTKRTLVFHLGRAPTGARTEWIMHEYSMNPKPTVTVTDLMVVCRLRRNTQFNLNENSNSTLTIYNKDGAEVASTSDKLAVHFDSASESDQKLSSLVESSSRNKDSDDGDCYVEILKDDIVKLDETSSSTTPGLQSIDAAKSEFERLSPRPSMPSATSTQGNASRRIRLRRIKLRATRSQGSQGLEKIRSGDCARDNVEILHLVQSSKGLLRLLTSMSVNISRLIFLLFIALALLVMLLACGRQ